MQKGLEKITTVMMTCLLVLILVLAVHSLTLSGAAEGRRSSSSRCRRYFMHMPIGRLWGTLFFLFMTFASFSTVIAVFENLIAAACDNLGWSRKKSALLNLVVLLVASLPCVFGYNIWSGLHIIGARDVLDNEDFIVSNLLLPIGSLAFLLFCVTKWGWGFDRFLAEANAGNGCKLSPKLKPYFQFVLPVLILAILIQGLL